MSKEAELAKTARQLQRMHNERPGLLSALTLYYLGLINPNLDEFDGQAERSVPYDADWTLNKRSRQGAEKRLRRLYEDIHEADDEPDPPHEAGSSEEAPPAPQAPESRTAAASGAGPSEQAPPASLFPQAPESHTAAADEAARKAAEEAKRDAAKRAAEAEKEAAKRAAEEAEKEAARKVAEEAEKEAARKAAEQAEKEAARKVAEEAEKEAARKVAEEAEKEAARKAAEQAEKEAARKAAEETQRNASRLAYSIESDSSSTTSTPSPGSSAQTFSWPNFESKVPKIKEDKWVSIKCECEAYGCDFADVKFRLEYLLQFDNPDATERELLNEGRDWLKRCPGILKSLEEMYRLKGSDFYKNYRAANPRSISQSTRDPSVISNHSLNAAFERNPSVFSADLNKDREEKEIGRDLIPPYEGWQDITVRDPDTGDDVKGIIDLKIGEWLDVRLPSLNKDFPDKEAHYLFPCSDYVEETKRFSEVKVGWKKSLKSGTPGTSLKRLKRKDITIMYYTAAEQDDPERWPRMYGVGYLKSVDGRTQTAGNIQCWSRSVLAKFGASRIEREFQQWRHDVGRQTVTIVYT